MADDSTEARVKRSLNDAQLTERRDILARFIFERGQVEEKKANAAEKYNAQLKTLNEQIHTIGIEIYEKTAWIPSQMALGEEPAEKMPPGVSGRAAKKTAKKAAKKKAGKKRTASNVSSITPPAPDGDDDDDFTPEAAE